MFSVVIESPSGERALSPNNYSRGKNPNRFDEQCLVAETLGWGIVFHHVLF